MFFLKRLTHTISLHPSFFGPTTAQFLEKKLHSEVEGKCVGRYGFIISVIAIDSIGLGTIQYGTGKAIFNIVYQAIVYCPFRNEVVDGVVGKVINSGFFVDVGPMGMFVATTNMPKDYRFDQNSNPFSYISDDNPSIEQGTLVRVRIIGSIINTTEIFAVGSILEDWLGPLRNES